MQNILPAFLMVFVSFLGLWISHKALMPRLMPLLFALTSMITLISFTGNLVPRSNKLTYLEAFALVNMISIFVGGLELITVHVLDRNNWAVLSRVTDNVARRLLPPHFLIIHSFLFIIYFEDNVGGYVGGVFFYLIITSLLLIAIALWIKFLVLPRLVRIDGKGKKPSKLCCC